MMVSTIVLPLIPNIRCINKPEAEQLLLLIKDYGLHPLDKHSENLNRFLMFIGEPRPA